MLRDKPDVSEVEIIIGAEYASKLIHEKVAFVEEYAYHTDFGWIFSGRKPESAAKNVVVSFVGVYSVSPVGTSTGTREWRA